MELALLTLDYQNLSNLSELIPVHIKEKMEHMKRLGMNATLETATRGAISAVAKQFGFTFLFAPNQYMGGFDTMLRSYPIYYDLPLEYTHPLELKNCGRCIVDAQTIDAEGKIISTFRARKHKLEEYPGPMPIKAFDYISPNLIDKAFVFDIIANPDPLLVYQITRKTFTKLPKIVTKGWGLLKIPWIGGVYQPITSPFYIATFAWK